MIQLTNETIVDAVNFIADYSDIEIVCDEEENIIGLLVDNGNVAVGFGDWIDAVNGKLVITET